MPHEPNESRVHRVFDRADFVIRTAMWLQVVKRDECAPHSPRPHILLLAAEANMPGYGVFDVAFPLADDGEA